jgi:hypothetical protein
VRGKELKTRADVLIASANSAKLNVAIAKAVEIGMASPADFAPGLDDEGKRKRLKEIAVSFGDKDDNDRLERFIKEALAT